MRTLRDFTLTALIAGAGLWFFIGPGAVVVAIGAGTLVAWDNDRRRQIASDAAPSGASMK